MRNVILSEKPEHSQCRCGVRGFFSHTPQGADLNTCPICGADDFVFRGDSDYGMHRANPVRRAPDPLWQQWFGQLADQEDDLEDSDPTGYGPHGQHLFCPQCKILFQHGCTHGSNGCTEDTYNAHLIGQWSFKNAGGQVYTGMPVFDSVQEWYEIVPRIDVKQWICPNKGLFCKCANYPAATNPLNYHLCNLPDKL